ncbi:MAG: hypothetical protein ACREUT_04685 [Steroidobacteraceae bacterium]
MPAICTMSGSSTQRGRRAHERWAWRCARWASPSVLWYSSPTFRARETIELAGLPSPTLVPQLAEGAHGMASSAEESHAAWLREAVDRFPPIGSNTLVVTHTPNIVGAFGPRVANIQGNEMLVFVPESGRRARLLGRITVELPAASP